VRGWQQKVTSGQTASPCAFCPSVPGNTLWWGGEAEPCDIGRHLGSAESERGWLGLSRCEPGFPCCMARQQVSQGTMALQAMASQPNDSKPPGLLAKGSSGCIIFTWV